jgi:aerobic-type carbon monoxide dehydrogenase small subunit (CoxS/CutS family)
MGGGIVNAIAVTVNGRSYSELVEPRLLLSDFLRHTVGLTGTHVGCEHGVCGACTVRLDGAAVRSCLLLAVQADGASIETVEGLAEEDQLSVLQQAFSDHHALQCGYCTPGMLMSATALLRENPSPTDEEIARAIQGNICRCTGYWNIVKAIKAASGQEVSE